MAVKKNLKKPVVKKPQNVEERLVNAIEEVGQDDTPFLKTDNASEIVVLGDAKKINNPENDTVYDVELILPKDEFNVAEFENVTAENDFTFCVPLQATQEKITPNNRTYLANTAVTFMMQFFFHDENGDIVLRSGNDMIRASYKFYRSDLIIENTKYFVGKLLGIDEEYILYMNELQLVENGIDLIAKNPSLINEAYFTSKH